MELVNGGRAEYIKDPRQLVVAAMSTLNNVDNVEYSLVAAREERLAAEHLGQDTAARPNVDGLRVRLKSKSMSCAFTLPYMRKDSMTSGARYHLVATSAINY